MTEYKINGMKAGGVTVHLHVEGPEKDAETVSMHAQNEIGKALKAIEERTTPEEQDGLMKIDWERRHELAGEQ